MRNLLVVGQSHVAAFRNAARTRRDRDPDAPRARIVHTGEPQYRPELIDELEPALAPPLADAIVERIARHDPLLVSVTGGNVHTILALIRHERPFDFLLDGEGPPPDPDAEPIPLGLVEAVLRRELARDFDRLRALRRIARFVHVESPPPLRDSHLIAERADRYFREAGIGARGIAAPGLRWRMWRLASRLVRAEVERLGCRFLPTPAGLFDDCGFLREQYAADATHGNEAYGHALIDEIMA